MDYTDLPGCWHTACQIAQRRSAPGPQRSYYLLVARVRAVPWEAGGGVGRSRGGVTGSRASAGGGYGWARSGRPRRRWPAAWRGSSGRRRPAWEPAIRPPPRRPPAATSPTSLGVGVRGVDGRAASVRVMPTSTTAAPGLTISAVTRPGPSRGHHHDVCGPGVRGEILGPGVAQRVTGSVLGAPGQEQAESAADGDPAPEDGDVGTRDGHPVVAQQFDDAVRRARQQAPARREPACRG